MAHPDRSPGDESHYPYSEADHLASQVHALGIHDSTPRSVQYDFQPFIPYHGSPFQPMGQQPYPPYGYSPTPYETIRGYPNHPNSNQPSSINPSPPFPPPGTMWTSPPMSPANSSIAAFPGQRADDFRQGPYYPGPSAYNPPYWDRPPRNSLPGGPRTNTFNRVSWSGPSRDADREQERKPYHPQPPARRSDWVMWVGNVPPNTSHEELWRYFNTNIPSDGGEPWRGPSSIFLISRSSCAFVNLSSQVDLDRAVAYFNGRPLRPYDARCPRLVCRVRRKEDDLRSGVGAQRGTGMHRDWIKNQEQQQSPAEPPSPAILEHPPEGEGRRRESIVDGVDSRHKSSASYASTNSSFLTKHFPLRVFILKSSTVEELEESVRSGTWRTQRHNEPILDQAFRTSQEVFLIFGANKAGEFFGYAKMVEPIDKEKAKKYSSGSSRSKPSQIIEEEEESNRTRGESEPTRPSYFLSPSQSHIASSSPGELTPAEEAHFPADNRANTDPSRPSKPPHSGFRAQTLDPKNVQPNYFPPIPIIAGSDEHSVDRQKALGGSSRAQQTGPDGILRKDTVLSPTERRERAGEPEAEEGDGSDFRIQWIKTGHLPFAMTKHLRNPWNSDREVKVSRDGTEVEPTVGSQLMAEWDKLNPTYAAV